MRTSPVILAYWLLLISFFVGCTGQPADDKIKTVQITPREKEHEEPVLCDTCSANQMVRADRSDITCPACGHTRTETLPTEVCLLKYTCPTCKTDIFPKEGDCCVFCSYGTVKCPSKQ